MKWQIVILAALFAFPALGRAADEDAKADLKKLEGTWDVVSMDVAGKKMEAGKGGPDKVVIKDGKMTFEANGKALGSFNKIRIELDPKKKPKALDIVRSEKQKMPCIYELTRDELKLAMPLPPQKANPKQRMTRPESFDTEDKPVMVLVAKRGKS